MTLTRLIAAAAAAALLILTGCTSPDNTRPADTEVSSTPSLSATPTPSTSPSAPAATPSSTPPTSSQPTPAAPAADVTVAVVVKDGKVTPIGDNVRVKDGQSVLITLDSDAAESIHVHGYDMTVEVEPGDSDRVTFVADQKGVFEVETHETEKLVVKLIVS